MNCDLCSTDGQGGETRCRKCGFDTTLPPEVKRFLTSLIGFRPGELLEGRYRIERILGFGGMSVVYKAHDDMLGEDVAIKVINGGRVADDAKLFTDIRRDIVTTRKLAHPAIIKVHDLHKADTCGFLTMEYVLGKDLASLIAERGKLDEQEVCRLAVQVAEALSYAHANGVVHCDIKPGNLLLTETGRVKIADFGISRIIQEENTGLTGLVVGTPAYMSPEQIRGERPTPLTDMYALGIVMWHCLMGAPPFTRGDIAYQHVHVPLPPLEGVSPEVERIVRKAAGKTMAERYPSLDVMAQELRRFLQGQADATIMQTPPPRPADTIMQTPLPKPVLPIMLTPPPQQAATIMQTPPPRPAEPAMQAAPAQTKATIAQTPPLRPADAIMLTPPPQPAAAAMQTPLSRTVSISSETTGKEAPAGGGPTSGGPTEGGSAGGTAQPSPGSPSASTNNKTAIAVIAVLLVAAAVWGLFFRGSGTAPVPPVPPAPTATTGTGGSQNPLAGRGLPGGGEGTAVGTTAPGGVRGGAAGGNASAPAKPAPRVVVVSPPQRAPEIQQSTPESTQSAVQVAKESAPVEKCTQLACFEFFNAECTPAVAEPGQTVRCTAQYSFRHKEGGGKSLEVEETVNLGIRSSRAVSHRVKAEEGMNKFEMSIKVPPRAGAGVYPVTLSVRRRIITESEKLQIEVKK